MSGTLRFLLLFAALLTAGWILYKIRKLKVKMEDAIFWMIFAGILCILGLFTCHILADRSPWNYVSGESDIPRYHLSAAGKGVYPVDYRFPAGRKGDGPFGRGCASLPCGRETSGYG